MIADASCKFCKRPLKLELDDNFMALASVKQETERGRARRAAPVIAASEFNPASLIALAACNRCADHKRAGQDLADAIKKACLRFSLVRKPSEDLLKATGTALEALTKKYVRLVAAYCGVPELAWEEAIVQDLLAKPEAWNVVLVMIWKNARAAKTLL